MSDEPEAKFAGCPHADIRDCPLYVAAHDGHLCSLSCIDGEITPDGNCRACRDWPYAEGLMRLRAAAPRLVAEIEFEAERRRLNQQRKSNMRAAGIQ